jgi:hypothetical protein
MKINKVSKENKRMGRKKNRKKWGGPHAVGPPH